MSAKQTKAIRRSTPGLVAHAPKCALCTTKLPDDEKKHGVLIIGTFEAVALHEPQGLLSYFHPVVVPAWDTLLRQCETSVRDLECLFPRLPLGCQRLFWLKEIATLLQNGEAVYTDITGRELFDTLAELMPDLEIADYGVIAMDDEMFESWFKALSQSRPGLSWERSSLRALLTRSRLEVAARARSILWVTHGAVQDVAMLKQRHEERKSAAREKGDSGRGRTKLAHGNKARK